MTENLKDYSYHIGLDNSWTEKKLDTIYTLTSPLLFSDVNHILTGNRFEFDCAKVPLTVN